MRFARVESSGGNIHSSHIQLASRSACKLPTGFTCTLRRRGNKRQRCAASKSPEPEFCDSNPEDDPQASDLDWRKFRASLIASEKKLQESSSSSKSAVKTSKKKSKTKKKAREKEEEEIWAHQISAPETGCLLFARRSAGDVGFFNNSVVFMVRHEDNVGSCGILLGRKSDIQHLNPLNQVLSMFSGLYCGGPVSRDAILLLHGPPALNHSEEIFTGVYLGGWPDAHEALLSGDELPDMTVFCGSCGWAPRQLQAEERRGTWAVVSASPKCVQQILQGGMDEGSIREWIRILTDVDDL